MRVRDLPLRVLATCGVACVVIAELAACTSAGDDSANGTVTGAAPLCYGPGPNMNLKPITTIRAQRTDGLTRVITVHIANGHNTYRMTLPAGRYTISAYSGRIHVIVFPHDTTRHADLPQPGCL